MRTAILDYLIANRSDLKPLVVVEGLPWVDSGTELYFLNKRHIYVDLDQVKQDPVIDTLNSTGVVNETTTVSVYFVTDAKTPYSKFEDAISTIKDARLTTDITGVTARTCQVSNTYESDVVLTTFEFSFKRLITN